MRLWHYRLIPFLPDSQLLSQWRELNSIFKKKDNHILINYVYEYPVNDIYIYSLKVIREMQRRGFKIKSFDNLANYTKNDVKFDLEVGYDYMTVMHFRVFEDHHNARYLRQCLYNLQEKFDRGQKDFTETQYKAMVSITRMEI